MGYTPKQFMDNPFTRWNQQIDDNPHHHGDWDDYSLFETDNFERMKPYQADSKDVVGEAQVIPMDDNDGVLHWYVIQGESAYTHPPDDNLPVIDHGLDEDKVWAFRMTAYNQSGVINRWAQNPLKQSQQSNVPFWGFKLATPVFYKDEKYAKFLKQWTQRQNLEVIKIKQAITLRPGDAAQRKQNKLEI